VALGEVVIIGAGPAGLATAACLRRQKVGAVLLDRSGRVGGAYAEMHGAMVLSSPASMNGLPGLAFETRGEYHTAAEYRDYLERYARAHHLQPICAEVQRVERASRGFRIETGAGALEAAAVVVASGMWSFPRLPAVLCTSEVPVLHAREWRGAAAHPAERILVVGGGTSAVEIAEELALSGRTVPIAVRSKLHLTRQRIFGTDVHHFAKILERLPTWLARRYCAVRPTLPAFSHELPALRAAGRIELRPPVERIEGGDVHFADGSRLRVDLIVAATGYGFDTPFLPEGLARWPAGHLRAIRGESVTWPRLFVVGAHCALGLDSQFLRGISHDAQVVAERISTTLQA
jgi:putative flavoprotein involved in K+ transport